MSRPLGLALVAACALLGSLGAAGSSAVGGPSEAAANASRRAPDANASDAQSAARLERVAEAEALVSPGAPKKPAREACRLQSRTHLQLANLSELAFQPADVCSTWLEMTRASPAAESPWAHVELLDLSHNNLSALLDSSGLSRLGGLLELRLAHNQLARCEEASLQGLRRLHTLDLSHNRLLGLPSKILQPVRHSVRKLVLSHNSISVLGPTLFESLTRLEHLDLSHNQLTSHWFDERLLTNLTELRLLDLSFNRLTVLGSPATLGALQQLESLSLQHNELRQVPDAIQSLRYLSSLDLSQNYIHDVTNASYLSNCRLLFNLNLEANLLENITRDAFSDLPALKVLNLANNRIHHLDQQAFDCK